MDKKRISIIGSTGSIGLQTLDMIDKLGPSYEVCALAARTNIDLLEAQARKYSPSIIAVHDEKSALALKRRLPEMNIVAGDEGLEEAASLSEASITVIALSGFCGVRPTIAAIRAKKSIALACKEVLVAAGSYVMRLCKELGVPLIPIDSEHSCLFQSLQNQDVKTIESFVLTASGGPFRNFTEENCKAITAKDALKHPTWNMGPKITVDSSTLMNKGLEMIEAYWLFDIPKERISVVVHPQSIIHSMIEFIDGYTMLIASPTSMSYPIQYALTYPERRFAGLKPYDFASGGNLEFYPPDTKRFPCLDIATHCLREGGSLPCYMNAANETLVHRFLSGQIHWADIPKKLGELIAKHTVKKQYSLEDLFSVDQEARAAAQYV